MDEQTPNTPPVPSAVPTPPVTETSPDAAISPYRPVVVAMLLSAIIVGGALMGSAMFLGEKLDALKSQISDIGSLGGGGGGGARDRGPDNDAAPADPAKLLSKGDPQRGPDDAQITIVEFSDYQCPFCERFYKDTLPQLFERYGEKVRFLYKDFPLPMHPDAQKAAEAAHCAGDQGKYWEYHNVLFDNQGSLGAQALKSYAQQIGLNTGKFESCLDGGKKAEKVKEGLTIGRNVGVTGTPTFFINGERLVGAQPIDAFQQKIDELLK